MAQAVQQQGADITEGLFIPAGRRDLDAPVQGRIHRYRITGKQGIQFFIHHLLQPIQGLLPFPLGQQYAGPQLQKAVPVLGKQGVHLFRAGHKPENVLSVAHAVQSFVPLSQSQRAVPPAVQHRQQAGDQKRGDRQQLFPLLLPLSQQAEYLPAADPGQLLGPLRSALDLAQGLFLIARQGI